MQEWLAKALAQQLPQLIAGHLPQILDDYVREATLGSETDPIQPGKVLMCTV